MKSDIDFDKAALIKARITMQKADPKRSFVECWNQLRREQSDLFREQEPGGRPKDHSG